MNKAPKNDFAKLCTEGGLLKEAWEFLKQNKKLWLIPIILALVMLGLLIVLGGTGAAPFIYTLF